MFGLGKIQTLGILIAGAVIYTSVISGGSYLKGRADGKSAGAIAALKAENAQLMERNETDAEVDSLDRYGLCVDLLGSVPDCDEFKN